MKEYDREAGGAPQDTVRSSLVQVAALEVGGGWVVGWWVSGYWLGWLVGWLLVALTCPSEERLPFLCVDS